MRKQKGYDKIQLPCSRAWPETDLMRRRKMNMKRSISIILALLLVLSIGLSAAYAEPADSSGENSRN